MEIREPSPARLTPMHEGGVSEDIASWLAGRGHLSGADRVRARVALKLAAKLDAEEIPAYALAKVSTELRHVMAELEGAAPNAAGAPEVRAMLREVLPR